MRFCQQNIKMIFYITHYKLRTTLISIIFQIFMRLGFVFFCVIFLIFAFWSCTACFIHRFIFVINRSFRYGIQKYSFKMFILRNRSATKHFWNIPHLRQSNHSQNNIRNALKTNSNIIFPVLYGIQQFYDIFAGCVMLSSSFMVLMTSFGNCFLILLLTLSFNEWAATLWIITCG